MRQPKLLIICGPTASGKTDFALQIAKECNGELVSADSRQLYQSFDIGTGKEVALLRAGKAQKAKDQWIIDAIPVHLYDIISGHETYSAYQYGVRAQQVIREIWYRNKLPILVGGTGLYIRAAISGLSQTGIIHESLREYFSTLSVQKLQTILALIHAPTLASMNESDRQNPRRLQRRIEQALPHCTEIQSEALAASPFAALLTLPFAENHDEPLHQLKADVFAVELTAPLAVLEERAARRVAAMMQLGLLAEITQLQNSGYGWDDPAFQAIGYKEFAPYFANQMPLAAVEQQIVLHSRQYIKRQQTWFAAEPHVNRTIITAPHWQQTMSAMIRTWYNTKNA